MPICAARLAHLGMIGAGTTCLPILEAVIDRTAFDLVLRPETEVEMLTINGARCMLWDDDLAMARF